MTFYEIDYLPELGEISVKTFEVKKITIKQAIRFNEKWHSRLPKISESNIVRNKYSLCLGVFYQGVCFAIAIITSPINPTLEKLPIVELRRLAICDKAPKNTASWFLGKITKIIFQLWPSITKIISYQDIEAHTGTIYKAANWVPARNTKFCDWDHLSRKRNISQSTSDKIRWEYNRPVKRERISNTKSKSFLEVT